MGSTSFNMYDLHGPVLLPPLSIHVVAILVEG